MSGVNRWERKRGIRANWRENGVISAEERKLSKRQLCYKNEQHIIKEFRWINKK